MRAMCMQESAMARRGHQVPWNQSYRWLWINTRVLGPEPRFSARTIWALNHWAPLQLSSERPSPFYPHAPTVFCLCALPLDNMQMPPFPAYSSPTSSIKITTSNYFLKIYLCVYLCICQQRPEEDLRSPRSWNYRPLQAPYCGVL